MHALTIVCPVDYSDCSKRALRFAGSLAEHFAARLVVLHVFDPLIAGTAALHQFDLTGADGQEELHSFTADHLPPSVRHSRRLERVLVLGTPGHEITRLARERDADLLVMGKQIARLAREAHSAAIVMSLGSSAMRRRKPGAIAYRVLCLAPVPVLALPQTPSGRLYIEYLHQYALSAKER